MPARILIIEDNPANLELMSYLLKVHGYELLTAGDGEKGMEIIFSQKPEMIICDIQLPKKDGYEVAQEVKKSSHDRAIPIVAVTALAMAGDRAKVLAAGFDGYITKPIDPESFVKQIQTFLPVERWGTVPKPTSLTETPPVRVPAKHTTLLVVDNLPVNISLAQSVFEPHGYHVLTAESVDDGLALAAQHLPAVILSDMHMPDKSGYDLIKAVKTSEQLRHIPVVLISSTGLSEKDRHACLELGATKFILRPIQPKELLTAVEACLLKRKEN